MKQGFFRAAVAAGLAAALSIPASATQMLVPVGEVVGLSLAEGTVTVVAFDEELGAAARDAGLQVGDEIVAMDGTAIDSAADLHDALGHSDSTVVLTLNREGKTRQLKLSPATTRDGPKLGVYIREVVTGIGTVTYYDPETGTFGALGHGVSRRDGTLAPMRSGNGYEATVVGVRAGQAGKPGQLRGAVSGGSAIAALEKNTSFGVFGAGVSWKGEALPVAQAGEVRPGEAQILSNISGDAVETFSVEILRVFRGPSSNGRDLMLEVTDQKLLSTTGGIVAGMSGSPILQDGKIVGAVTHVCVWMIPTTSPTMFPLHLTA